MRGIFVAASCMVLGACYSIFEGRSQNIAVNTNPAGADCSFYREGVRIATLSNTPASAYIEKTKDDIWIACSKPGYQMAMYLNRSGTAGVTWGNVLGGGIGWAVDSARGADNKYESPVSITLVPLQHGAVENPVPLPQNFGTPLQPAPTTEPSSVQQTPVPRPPAPPPRPAAQRSAPPPLQPPERTSAPLPLAPPPEPADK